MGARTPFRMVYRFGRLGLFLVTLLPYVTWKTWKAKSYFRNELLSNGIPKDFAANLADSYDDGNKNILRSVFRNR